jgi:hypothetical protein
MTIRDVARPAGCAPVILGLLAGIALVCLWAGVGDIQARRPLDWWEVKP